MESDVNLTAPTGKPRVYEAIGVAEYLVVDPGGDLLGTPVWARRAGPRGYEPWAPDAAGRWASAALGIAFQPHGLLLRVYDQEGRLVPLTDELAAQRDALAAQRDQLAAQRDALAEQLEAERRRAAALEAELRRLRGE